MSYALGEAVRTRIGDAEGVTVRRQASKDVALQVLRHSHPPRAEDLHRLLKIVIDREKGVESLEGAWAFSRAEDDELLRFNASKLYVIDDSEDREPIIDPLRQLGLPFVQVEWVRKGVGLASLLLDLPVAVQNVAKQTAATALELMRRLPEANPHDQVAHDYDIRPVVDFLVDQSPARITLDLRLGFLVRTAHQDWERRNLGLILLKPQKPVPEDEALWQVCFRRVFGKVDAGFSRELHRLLAVHPHILDLLHASDCRVAVARAKDVLTILHQVRLAWPDIYQSLEREINEANGRQPDLAICVANALLEAADDS